MSLCTRLPLRGGLQPWASHHHHHHYHRSIIKTIIIIISIIIIITTIMIIMIILINNVILSHYKLLSEKIIGRMICQPTAQECKSVDRSFTTNGEQQHCHINDKQFNTINKSEKQYKIGLLVVPVIIMSFN